ncbi:Tetratricopeptide repeat (TPR)-like superfamily protein [Arabidopsis thaliana]|uniref:Pentatricopeptide repeat-containing protein At4g16470 n=1 Tax=Arabidopsis thaliana TaxID=3702 RepID=PP315_ARATH|nr:Tetratricopeptide repeat (TPR)-like superfamily protein [Arabidopsis thaliana]O23491.2 RecName: Full=Pentatricopeptide repeat-containing protein At4g16470 [Arabidopsis thaliana]AEE83758.1 Tetratricopeptide repeat (TPR)-like superfamily protein [Arabidopsis thaliana]|eukprot:NP_193380.3 Tetratricopeptide repeat (TPR)-like superfamily protein [Arabidopsis thaliana]
MKTLISSSLSHKSQCLTICFKLNKLAMVYYTREFQTEASQTSASGSMFSGNATTILRRMLAEKRIGRFQVENQRKTEKLDKTLKGLCVTGRLKEAVGLLWSSGLQVEPETYAVLLQECKQRKEYTKGKRIHAQMFVVGFALNEYLKVKLLILYALSGDLQTAGILFRSLKIRDLIPWNAMISGYVQKGLEQEGLFIYYDMRQNRIVPDQYTFASVFRACSALDRLEHGKRAHAVMIKRCIKSNIIVDSALVDMYFKCSSFSDGHRVFDQLSTRNVITWTSLISGYGYHGKVSEVLKCFEKMKEEGCRPNPVTFLVVLTACNHGGLVDKGWEHFYSMKRDYGIEPEGQHYAAMVDTLGRAGRLQEAYEFVMKSPCKEHPPVWGSLLGACRIHGNVKLLELAATKFLELDPTNGGNYVVFANGYASCGLREAASKVRRKMENAGVKKDPGYSQIELQGEVHRFMKDDTSHRLSEKIYKKVHEMTSFFMDIDYYPDGLDSSCPV